MTDNRLLQQDKNITKEEPEEGIYTSMKDAAQLSQQDEEFSPEELRRARSSIITLAIGGLLAGYDIGIVGVFLAFYKAAMSIPCVAAESEFACKWLAGTSDACYWSDSRNVCLTNGMGQLCLYHGGDNDAAYCANLSQVWSPKQHVFQNISCMWKSTYNNVTDSLLFMNNGACVDNLPSQKASLWNSPENGAIAGMLIAGGFIGSFFARKYVATPLKTVKALQWIGVISVISCIFHIGAWFVPDFSGRLALVLIARFVAGIVLGTVSVFCVLFNALNSPPALVSPIGVYFQVFLTLGIFLAALFGYIIRYSPNKNAATETASDFLAQNDSLTTDTLQKFQLPFAMNIAVSFILIALPYLVTVKGTHLDYFDGQGATSRNSFSEEREKIQNEKNRQKEQDSFKDTEKVPLRNEEDKDQINNNNTNNEQAKSTPTTILTSAEAEAAAAAVVDPWRTWKDFLAKPHLVLAGTILALIQQYSSINAVMFYAPTIASGQGISDVFLSNLIIMAWNFLTAIVAIPVAKWGKQRWGLEAPDIYTPSAFIGALACFITGIPSYPGVASESVHTGLSFFGLALFIFIFEIGMGPHFYTMTQSIFPVSVRKTACVYTNAIHFIFTATVAFGFPIVIEGFGGTNGNGEQNDEQKQKGIASAFIMFGCINLVSVAVLKLLLPRLLREKEEKKKKKKKEINCFCFCFFVLLLYYSKYFNFFFLFSPHFKKKKKTVFLNQFFCRKKEKNRVFL